MAGCYVVAVVLILIFNFTAIPGALVEIVQSAFGLRAVTGGTIGGMLMAMQMGVARGIFSNEAGPVSYTHLVKQAGPELPPVFFMV